jgi:hypothetical protein
MHMSTVLSASVLHSGVQGVEVPIAIYDVPSERQRLRLIGVDANLKTVGVHQCKPIDRATLAALDLQTVAVACYPPRLADTLGDSLGHLAPARVRPERRAKPCSPTSRAFGEGTEKADHDGSKPRQTPRAAVPGEAGMTRALSAGLLVALLSAMPAAADHCPPGQFYRVRLNQCVGLNTRLASAYVHAAASRLATPGSGDRTGLPVEPEAKPVGEPKIVVPFVLPTLNDWPSPK